MVVGDESFIGEHAVVNPGVKVYPFKTVESGAVVNASIVWESRGARTLFGRRGVSGLANVDITPETTVRLAMAYGTALKKGSVVTTSRDTSRAARALKRAAIAGLNLAGVNVNDVELATVPLTRFQIRNSGGQGGLTVRLVPDDPNSVEIRIFDSDGRDIDEAMQRRIERLQYREDYRRAFAGDIGDIVFPPAPSSSTPPPCTAPSTSRGCATRVSRWSSTTRTARRRWPCRRSWPRSAPTCSR